MYLHKWGEPEVAVNNENNLEHLHGSQSTTWGDPVYMEETVIVSHQFSDFEHLPCAGTELDTHTHWGPGGLRSGGLDLARSHAAFQGFESLCIGAALGKK